MSYYYTECPFGKFPVDCDEDLCAGRRCPGYPNAVCRVNRCGGCSYEWYNGVTGNILQCQGTFLRYEPPRGKTNNVVSEQVRHKATCTSTEKSQKLEISDLSRRGIVLSE